MPEDDALDVLKDMLPSAPWLASSLPELEQIPLDHWQAEYTRLFVSGYPKTPCPPFESAYRQGTMGGTTAGDLGSLYRRADLQATEVPADYLGTQLEFAAYLLERSDGKELLLELTRDHLAHWLPRFAQDLQAHSQVELYRSLGVQLADVLKYGEKRD